MKPGLVSVTFRKLLPHEIIDLVVKSGLSGIEWGGDVHVPHGEADTARMVKRMTLDAGLNVSSYGSYYRVAESEKEGLLFGDVLESAIELGAPVVRVWAGRKGSSDAGADYRKAVVDDLARIGAMADRAGIMVCCEYHGGTLTDTDESAALLMREVDHTNVRLYWQPHGHIPFDKRLQGLKDNLEFVENLHAYSWKFSDDGKVERQPLEAGVNEWKEYLAVAGSDGRERWVLLEFVKDDTPEQFLADARTLQDLVSD